MNMFTTMAKGKKVLKIPRRDGSFRRSHSMHLCHCSFDAQCHSKLPFVFTRVFFSLSANFSSVFLWVFQQVYLVREGKFLSSCFQQECITMSTTYCTRYKAKEKQPDVHIKRKRGAWALTDTSNFPGTSRVKGGQITESAQAHSYR